MDDEIDRKIDVTAMQILLVQNIHHTNDRTLIGSGTNGLGILEWPNVFGVTVTSFTYKISVRAHKM